MFDNLLDIKIERGCKLILINKFMFMFGHMQKI